MSGSTIGGIAGAFIGSFFGPMGTQIGWMLGSAVGGYVDPDVIKNSGPRLTDATQQTARDGVPIPFGYGVFPTTGNIIWRQPNVTENVITTRERQGKGGGPVVENTTYQYTRSYAIGICEGPIAGLLIVKKNGAIVYDARTDAELAAIGYTTDQIATTRAASAAWLASGVRFYTGGETQVADPVIESYEGVGNVVPFRGLAYLSFEDDDVTELRGAIPQYDFVVVKDGNSAPGVGMAQWAATDGSNTCRSDNGTDWVEPNINTSGAAGLMMMWGNGRLVKWKDGVSGPLSYSTDRGETWSASDVDLGPPTGTVGARFIGSRFWMVNGDDPFDVSNSTDGDVWTTTHVVGTANAYTAVGGHSGLILLGTNAGTVVYSTDGGSTFPYTATALGAEVVYDIATNGTLVVIVGDDNAMARTTDGASWTAITSPFLSDTIRRIRYNNGLWVAHTSNQIAYSSDGIGWTLASAPAGGTFKDMDANGGLFVIVGSLVSTGAAIWTSADGATWTKRDDVFPGASSVLTGVVAMPCDGTPIPGAPGFYVHDDGTICGPAGGTLEREQVVLGTIVADICQRRGLTSDQYDVSDLTDLVDGYKVATEGGGDSFIAPLMAAYFFDAAEWDGKIRFIKRGGPSQLTLTMDDLAERDGDAIEIVRAQEAELLRKNSVAYLDPLATYTATTQQWERRAGTIQAKGEAIIELPVVMDSTTAAQVAERRGKVAWSESDKYAFSLPSRFSRITPTDRLTLIDADSNAHRIRVMKIDEDSGVLLLEDAARDRQQAYIGTVTGAAPSVPPGQQPPPVRGPAIAVAFNGPPPTINEDSKAGIWVLIRGLLPGYVGSDLYISSDGGDTESYVGRFLNQARIGWLRSGISSSATTIPVQFYGDAQMETITDEQVDTGQNIWIIKTGENAEFGQSQTVTPNGDGFDLTDNTRGLLETPVTSHNADDDFGVIDANANYVPVDIRLKGVTLILRAVPIGTNAEDSPTFTLVYDPPEIVWDGNGDDDEGEDGPDPDPGGAGTPGTPTSRTVDPGTTTVSLSAGEANATANCAAINAAYASYGTVITPAGTYYIDTANPIEPATNSVLDLKTNGTTLIAKGSNTTTAPATHRDMIRIDGVHDVVIKGGKLIGYRDYWRANGGVSAFGVSEWAHGIYVTNGAYNVTIYDTSFDKFVGDGISLGRSAHDIHILNIKSTNNRRQGISTGADDVLIENSECAYIGQGDGTAPRAGIDIEIDGPETNTSNNTTIRNCYLHHNAGPGLICYRSCDDITIEDLRSEYNTKGIYAYDSQNVTISGNSLIRWNKYEGTHLASTCANWNMDGVMFYSNKTQQYGTFAVGLDTTTSPTTTQKAKHITVASTVTGTTYGTNDYGPV